jgi:tRNA(adenine34) deaminase
MACNEDDKGFMAKAIMLAKSKGTDPSDTPIAALIVKDGQIIAQAVNQTTENCDATAHAEIVAIRKAGVCVGDMDLSGATLYSTLQPCGMCSMASIWASIGRIVYGADRDQVHKMYFEDRTLSTMDYISDAYRDDLSLEGPCLGEECAKLYFSPDDDVPEDLQGNT